MKVHDMQRSDREKKARFEDLVVPGIEGRDFAHGLHLRLDEPELKKLGIAGVPKFGDVFRIEGEMRVTESRARDSESAATREIEFVLHKLGAEPKAGRERKERSVREDLEDARHQAHGTTMGAGHGAPLGARLNQRRA